MKLSDEVLLKIRRRAERLEQQQVKHRIASFPASTDYRDCTAEEVVEAYALHEEGYYMQYFEAENDRVSAVYYDPVGPDADEPGGEY